jgi:hypothetical protein
MKRKNPGTSYYDLTLSDKHKELIEKWDLKICDELYKKLLNDEANLDEIHKMLQLWRKINANNMLYSLGNRRHVKTVESRFTKHVDMPEGLSEALDRNKEIVYPLRLADKNLLKGIVDEIVIAPESDDDIRQNVLKHGYVTISHVWIDGKMDTKGPLCKNALVDLEAEYVWMDKLCINQINKKEVSLEVPRLKDYYKTSPLCLLAVSTSTKSIIDMDNSITQLWNFHEIIKIQEKSPTRLSTGMIFAYKEKMGMLIGQLARNNVLHHQWFTRIWTLPEMSVTQDLIVSNGDQYAYLTPLIVLIRIYGHAKSREMFIDEGIVECYDALRMTGGYERFTLSEAIESSVGRTSGAVQDKIYALMGMVEEIKGLDLDYEADIDEILSRSCRLAYEEGDVTWILNTHVTKGGFPVYGTRFLCPLQNDKMWLTHDYVEIVQNGINIHGSKHHIESWTHIHNVHEMDVVHRGGRLSHDVVMWSNLLVHVSNDIKELVKLAAWIGIASSTSFGVILVVVFCMSRPVSDLSVVIPLCVGSEISTSLVVGKDKDGKICKMHIGRSVIIGSGVSRRGQKVLVA